MIYEDAANPSTTRQTVGEQYVKQPKAGPGANSRPIPHRRCQDETRGHPTTAARGRAPETRMSYASGGTGDETVEAYRWHLEECKASRMPLHGHATPEAKAGTASDGALQDVGDLVRVGAF